MASRYSLESKGQAQSDQRLNDLVEFPNFMRASGIPAPKPESWLRGHLAVVADEQLEADGFLGSRWFAGSIWEFDYGAETLSRVDTMQVSFSCDHYNQRLDIHHDLCPAKHHQAKTALLERLQ